MDEKALFKLSYGLYLLTARSGERDNGCIINTLSQVTNTPNRLCAAVNKSTLTHDLIRDTGLSQTEPPFPSFSALASRADGTPTNSPAFPIRPGRPTACCT